MRYPDGLPSWVRVSQVYLFVHDWHFFGGGGPRPQFKKKPARYAGTAAALWTAHPVVAGACMGVDAVIGVVASTHHYTESP